MSHDEADDFITCNSEAGKLDTEGPSGLSKDHAFAVLGTIKLDNGKRLVKIRNPWGNELAKAGFSDAESLNEGGNEKEAGYKDTSEGIAYIDVETYMIQFSETFVSFDVTGWSSAKFMKLSDHSAA